MKWIRHSLTAIIALLTASQTLEGASVRPGFIHVRPPYGLAHSGWPKDRGDAANTGRSSGQGARGRLRWIFHERGIYLAEPALGPDHALYVGGSNGIYCLGQRDGRERRGFTARVRRMDAQEDKAAVHARIYDYKPYDGSHGSYGILTIGRDGTAYAGSDNGKLYAFDGVTGGKIWEFRLGSGGGASQATVGTDGTVYFGSNDHDIYALDGATGKLRWKHQTGDEVGNTPALGLDGTLYVGSRDSFIYALNSRTGRLRWKFATSDVVYSAVALGEDGLAYAACKNGYVYALAARTGRRVWATRLYGEIFNSPALGTDGTVYITVETSRSGTYFYALDGRTGRRRWEVPKLLSGTGSSSIALAADGTIYAVSDRLYALDGRTGRTEWTFNAHSPIGSPAVGLDGTVYFTTANGRVYAIR